ncbi:hypothetical protein ANA_C20198 [Anabaena sp. 90]|nr:hypothetical protein ANA_C20198 [Anabaena sp. 90]
MVAVFPVAASVTALPATIPVVAPAANEAIFEQLLPDSHLTTFISITAALAVDGKIVIVLTKISNVARHTDITLLEFWNIRSI